MLASVFRQSNNDNGEAIRQTDGYDLTYSSHTRRSDENTILDDLCDSVLAFLSRVLRVVCLRARVAARPMPGEYPSSSVMISHNSDLQSIDFVIHPISSRMDFFYSYLDHAVDAFSSDSFRALRGRCACACVGASFMPRRCPLLIASQLFLPPIRGHHYEAGGRVADCHKHSRTCDDETSSQMLRLLGVRLSKRSFLVKLRGFHIAVMRDPFAGINNGQCSGVRQSYREASRAPSRQCRVSWTYPLLTLVRSTNAILRAGWDHIRDANHECHCS